MSRGGKAASAVCAIAALAAVVGAAALWREARTADVASSPKAVSIVSDVRTAVAGALRPRELALEREVKGAALIPQLKAAVADGVDSATVLDLFETEDWWIPFRARSVALIEGSRILAVRGDKDIPPPSARLLAQVREAGIASGILGTTAHPVVVAVAPLAAARDREPSFLMFDVPLDAAELNAAVGGAILISDGRAAPPSAGGLASLIGREREGVVAGPATGALAVAVALSPELWLWVVREGVVPPAPARGKALGLLVAAILFGLAALGLRTLGDGSTVAAGDTHRGTSPMIGPGGTVHIETAPPPDESERSGSQKYARDEIAHRPTAVAESDLSAGSDASQGAEQQVAQAAVAASFPDRAPVDTDQSTFGRYRLIERLGEGGMAEIYTAVMHGAEGFRRIFVVKRLRPELARNRVAVDHFIDEAKLGSTFSHPNIVPVFDFGKVGDEYFMAQEYIIGRDMGRFLQRHFERTGRGLDELVVLYVAHEVLDALSYVHALVGPNGEPLGLVHRDISPGNIMVTARGQVKLFDFGIVKAEGRATKTEVGVVKGNVSFMSPEQARGQAVDARSDLFSLGLVVYSCLTNDTLYPSENTFEQLMKAAAGPKTEQLSRLAELPPVAASVIGRALAVDPAERYQNAAEFAAALAPYISGAKAELAAMVRGLFDEEFRRESLV